MALVTAPSGKDFDDIDRLLLRLGNAVGFIQWYDKGHILASGHESHIYVEGREDTTQNPGFLSLACWKILKDVKDIMGGEQDFRHPRFIGIPHAAYGWTSAITMVDHFSDITHRQACHLVMRASVKGHGGREGKWVAGKPNPKEYRDILFDNVVTTAGSMKVAAKHLVEDGWKLADVDAMVFVDRHQGGLEEMRRVGFHQVHACYNLLDIAYVLGEIGVWPKAVTKKIEQEIKKNQFA